eukprot:CAMPEP_0202442466 /NCGR_PEP_ID=MMETSP1360-20130828/1925_1 /ASSEMBLY_ACC=CAM_ASM_000848 /TAXON_ID=515479 /ORGANISM="Licmophora paradoxa, Strain CCMP2313" /LENGTH=314 /DNA_ID=CAMNT_0049057851 /DNA_START=126 /DNA_END=1070 /DNA_ORIENTATION=-
MSDQEQPPPPPPPSFFSTNDFDTGISIVDEDEYGEEPTRRVEMAPSFSPFSPGPLSFDPMVGTAASKTAPLMAPSIPFSCPILPTINHPLEQTSVCVKHTDAAIVLERVEEMLKSVDYEDDVDFETDRVNAKIRGWTMDGVEFRIFFYTQDNSDVMVEIQRRSGRSWDFGRMAQRLLNVAEGKQDQEDQDDMPPPPPSSSDSSPVSLGFVKSMMNLNTRLALQTLYSMTSADKMGRAAAKAATKQLLIDQQLGMQILNLAKNEWDALRVLHNVVSLASRDVPEQLVSTILSTLEETKVEGSQRLVERIQKKLRQ